jgi:hypothetical protein
VAARPDGHKRRRQPREEAGDGAAPLALPEPEVEMVLVGTRITTEPGVTVDAKDWGAALLRGVIRRE